MRIGEVNIPSDLVRAASDGNLVLFVGAGASKAPPSNLPDFIGLIERIGHRVGMKVRKSDRKRPDVFLGRVALEGIDVHQLVREEVEVEGSAPNDLHRAIVKLAAAHPAIRIVTTNWDGHLTAAAAQAGVCVEVFAGPAVPLGDDFDGIVHLHGALTQPTRRLIATDEDFGDAYLRSAWAARFLERMFASSTVLFIGYSHSDLVLRYLSRSLGPTGTRFAATTQPDTDPDWRALGLVPVHYDSHGELPEVLSRWADRATLTQTDARARIAALVADDVPAIPEDLDFLEACLGEPERVRYFTEYARGPQWLDWVSTRPEFQHLFSFSPPRAHSDAGGADAGAHAEATLTLTRWVVDHYVLNPDLSHHALRLMHARDWSDDTLTTIEHRLVSDRVGGTTWGAPWLALALTRTPPGPDVFLDMLASSSIWIDDEPQPDADAATADTAKGGDGESSEAAGEETEVPVNGESDVTEQSDEPSASGRSEAADATTQHLLSLRDRLRIAFDLFEHRTSPVPGQAWDFGPEFSAVRFEVDLAGEEHALTTAWESIWKPRLDHYAPDLLDLAIAQLGRLDRLHRALHPGEEHGTGLGRSAIEDHEQDDIRNASSVLIDAARDSLEYLLEHDAHAAAEYLHRLERRHHFDGSLVRRLTVHGWRLRTDRTADEKLDYILEHGLLYDLETQHEVFLLLHAALPDGTEDRIAAVVDAAENGQDHLLETGPLADSDADDVSGNETQPIGEQATEQSDAGRGPSTYQVFNLLTWMSEARSDSRSIVDALARVRDGNPEYRRWEHPDLNGYMFGGDVEDALPVSADELHAQIADDSHAAIAALVEWRTRDNFALTGPTWDGALNAVRAVTVTHPMDGLIVSAALNTMGDAAGSHDAGSSPSAPPGFDADAERQLRDKILRAWTDASMTAAEIDAVLEAVAQWDLVTHRQPIAWMLAGAGTPTRARRWVANPAARDLAERLWRAAPETTTPEDHDDQGDSTTDLTIRAYNAAGGLLAQFWLTAVEEEWRAAPESWTGLPRHLRVPLKAMVTAKNRDGLLAVTMLATQLRFLHTADAAWTTRRLLPRFNWTKHPDTAVGAWIGFLTRGRSTEELLHDGLLDLLIDTTAHATELDGRAAHRHLAQHLASVALDASIEPSTWLTRFVAAAPPDVRAQWSASVARRLATMSPEKSDRQWTRWIGTYLKERVASAPRRLEPAEASALATWVPGLPGHRDAATDLLVQVPIAMPDHGRLLELIAELCEPRNDAGNVGDEPEPADALTDAPFLEAPAVGRLLAHVLSHTPDATWDLSHYLPGIVRAFRTATPPPAATTMAAIVDQALRLGCPDAPTW